MKIKITDLTTKDILNIDPSIIYSLNKKDMLIVTNKIIATANRRIRELRKDDIGALSPALASISKRDVFSTKDKKLSQLRNEFKQVKSFLEKKSSTLQGFKKIRKKIYSKIVDSDESYYTPFDDLEQEKRFWELYRRIEEEQKGGVRVWGKNYGSTQLQKDLRKLMVKYKRDSTILKHLNEKITQEYEEESKYNVGVEDVFTITKDI